jgi:hypothetical protein
MPLETALWIAISVGGPPVAAWIWPRLRERLPPGVSVLLPLSPWLHSIGPSYFAILSGAVLGRDYGLYGVGPARFVAGVLACAGGSAVAALARRWLRLPEIGPINVLLEEPRWALYRAAGLLWLPGPVAGVALGVGLALMETGLRAKWWQPAARHQAETWFPVLRACLSAVIFAATRSFWLAAAAQFGILTLRPSGPPKDGEGVP